MAEFKVTGLHIHPVKSTRVQSVEILELTADGATGDRRYMLIDDAGHAITARDVPKLVLVRADAGEGGLRLQAPGMPDLDVVAADASLGKVTIWADAVDDLGVYEAASAWFTQYLERSCRLVRVKPESARKGPLPVLPVAFQDAAPLLVVSAASLDAVNAKLEMPVTMAHFRPNIVISGPPSFDEDCWARFRIGDVMFHGHWGCSRCVFTTIDPVTSDKMERGEPLRSMTAFRQGNDNKVYFGQNASLDLGINVEGTIKVGDTVEVLERLPGLVSLTDYFASLQAR